MEENDEPAVKEPFIKDLIVSTIIFGFYLLLCYLLPVNRAFGTIGLLPFSIINFGLVIVIVFSAITWPFRMLLGSIPLIGKHLYEWGTKPSGLLACALCTGMWTGTLIGATGLTVYNIISLRDLIAHGMIGAGSAWILYAVTKRLGVYDE